MYVEVSMLSVGTTYISSIVDTCNATQAGLGTYMEHTAEKEGNN